jgi:hypothetical protein
MSTQQMSPLTQKNLHDVTQKKDEHTTGIIAEMEVGPYNESLMSLGAFDEGRQPKGFCLEFTNEPTAQEKILSEITTAEQNGRLQYVLRVVNDTPRALCVEISQL